MLLLRVRRVLKVPASVSFRRASFGRDTNERLPVRQDGRPQDTQTGIFNARAKEEIPATSDRQRRFLFVLERLTFYQKERRRSLDLLQESSRINSSCRSRSAVPCFALESQCRGRDFLRVRPQDVCFSGGHVISTRLLQEVYFSAERKIVPSQPLGSSTPRRAERVGAMSDGATASPHTPGRIPIPEIRIGTCVS